jgi:hypothetical protein
MPRQIQVKVQTHWRGAARPVQKASCSGNTDAFIAGDLKGNSPGMGKHCIPATTCEPKQWLGCWFAVLYNKGKGCVRQV